MIFLPNREKELIECGIINADSVCVCCGERYAINELLCNSCKNAEFVSVKEKPKPTNKIKFKLKEFLK